MGAGARPMGLGLPRIRTGSGERRVNTGQTSSRAPQPSPPHPLPAGQPQNPGLPAALAPRCSGSQGVCAPTPDLGAALLVVPSVYTTGGAGTLTLYIAMDLRRHCLCLPATRVNHSSFRTFSTLKNHFAILLRRCTGVSEVVNTTWKGTQQRVGPRPCHTYVLSLLRHQLPALVS